MTWPVALADWGAGCENMSGDDTMKDEAAPMATDEQTHHQTTETTVNANVNASERLARYRRLAENLRRWREEDLPYDERVSAALDVAALELRGASE
jgi:hypothetical protein